MHCLIKLLSDQGVENMATKKITPNKIIKEEIPPVIPLMQTEVKDDGTVVTKRVKPLTYSLISWVKVTLDLEDTVDISDDENFAEFEISNPSSNEEYEFRCYFNVDEVKGLILLYIYCFDCLIHEGKEIEMNHLSLRKNLDSLTGQFQLVSNKSNGKYLRYFSGISVEGIASEDPDYSGEFQISPKLYDNMFKHGINAMNGFIYEAMEHAAE